MDTNLFHSSAMRREIDSCINILYFAYEFLTDGQHFQVFVLVEHQDDSTQHLDFTALSTSSITDSNFRHCVIFKQIPAKKK